MNPQRKSREGVRQPQKILWLFAQVQMHLTGAAALSIPPSSGVLGQAGFSETLNAGKGGGGMERSWEGWPKEGRHRGVSLQRMQK